jgi:hypothetical protein
MLASTATLHLESEVTDSPRVLGIPLSAKSDRLFVTQSSAPVDGATVVSASARRCLDGGDVVFSSTSPAEGTLWPLPPAASASVSARGVICRRAPAALAPTALAFLAAIADDRVPVAVRLFLSVRLIRKEKASLCLNVGPPLRPRQGMPRTVNSTVGDRRLAARVTGRLVGWSLHYPERSRRRSAPRMRLVEPEADRVLWASCSCVPCAPPGRSPQSLCRTHWNSSPVRRYSNARPFHRISRAEAGDAPSSPLGGRPGIETRSAAQQKHARASIRRPHVRPGHRRTVRR